MSDHLQQILAVACLCGGGIFMLVSFMQDLKAGKTTSSHKSGGKTYYRVSEPYRYWFHMLMNLAVALGLFGFAVAAMGWF